MKKKYSNFKNFVILSFGSLNFCKFDFLFQNSFFRLTDAEPVTPHDEYWHKHIDTNQYETFDYTALIYLNDQGEDYQGLRLIDSN